MRRFLAVLGVLAGSFGLLFGMAGIYVSLYRKDIDFPPAAGVVMAVFIIALGVALISFSVSKWSACPEAPRPRSRLLTRIFLRGFGVLVVLFAMGGFGYQVEPGRSHGFLWFVLMFPLCILPFAFGCWLIAEADNHYAPEDKRPWFARGRVFVFKAGRVLLFFLAIIMLINHPRTGCEFLALFAVLVFAAEYYVRTRPKLKGGGVMTPFGRLDAAKAKVVDGLAADVAGWLLMVLELGLEILVAVLTGGAVDVDFAGGGGSSGGGGASGGF